jgi:hypothetical protein
MTDPSDALPVIVKQFIDPQRRAMDRLVARLAPGLSPAEVERCTRSLVGQVFFYLTHRPALLLLMGVASADRVGRLRPRCRTAA